MAKLEALTDGERELMGALTASGFNVDLRQLGGRPDRRARAIRATQDAQPDLAPYFFVSKDQWARSDERRDSKLDVVRQKLLEQRTSGVTVIGDGRRSVVDKVLFDLLGLDRAVVSYRQRFQAEARQIIESPVRIDGQESSSGRLRGTADNPSLWILLAPGGWGKTSFCRKMALELAVATSPQRLAEAPFPVLVEFTREVEALPFEDLLVRFCRDHRLDANRSGGLGYLMRQGKAILIVDGFDELASTFGLDKARLALERVLGEACAEFGRAVVSSRTQFYELVSHGTILGHTLNGTVREQYAELAPPDSMKLVRARLGRRLGSDETQELEKHFARLPGELGSSPLAATWTAEEVKQAGISALEKIRSAVDFYEWYIRRRCSREENKRLARVTDDGAERVISVDEQILWLEGTARYMLEYGGYEVTGQTSEDLSELLAAMLAEAVPSLELATGQEELLSHALLASDQVAHQLVVRFIHPSVRDFLLARLAATGGSVPDLRGLQRPTPELARFLGEYLWDQKLGRGEFIALTEGTVNSQLWQSLIVFAGLESPALEDATSIERRKRLEAAIGLVFEQLDLTQVRVQRVDLVGASFRGATLRQTRFRDCDLSHADFRRAHLEEVEFRACSLHGAEFDDATFASGYISEDEHRGSRLTGDDLFDAVIRATELVVATEPRTPEGKTQGWVFGQLVGYALRAFVTRGGQMRRTRLRESILRSRETRYQVQNEIIPVLMKSHIGVLARGRPTGGRETILLEDLATVKSWFEEEGHGDPKLRDVLRELLRRSPSEAELEEFVTALRMS